MTYNAINECYIDRSLTSPLRTGIIRLLRKGQKDLTLTGSYRPISLLSIHYKLASCCITQRLRHVWTIFNDSVRFKNNFGTY